MNKGSQHTWKAFLLHWEGQGHLSFLAFRLYHSSKEISHLEAQLGAFHTQVYILATRLSPAVPLEAGVGGTDSKPRWVGEISGARGRSDCPGQTGIG